MAEVTELTDEDVQAAARHWLAQGHWQEIIKQSVHDRLPGHLRRDSDTLADRLLETGAEGIGPLDSRRGEAELALESAGYPMPPYPPELLDRTATALADTLKLIIDQRVQEVFRPEENSSSVVPTKPEIAPPAAAVTSLISQHVDEWLADIQNPTEEGKKPIPFLHAKQKGVTVRILTELIGDKPAGSVTRDDAKEFRKQLLKLPASHGKGRYVHAREAIAKVENSGAALMKLKTVKRYFSALNGYWQWLEDKKFIPEGPSPFAGHSFPGTKSSKRNRDDWSIRDLERLFRSADYRAYAWDSADHWLPLIALHSGMRLEEIARLRTDHDIIFEGKVPCFKIQVHPDGWDPKTEAGEREIPVHSWLVKHGFLKLVEQRRREGSDRIFSDLSNAGVTGTYGAEFSKRFSNLKIGIGVSAKTVFHSFRHSFRTEVDATEIEERFIDAVMGHEGKRGEGATYRKRVALHRRQQVVEAFRSPLPLDFLDSPHAPVRPARVRKVRLQPRLTTISQI